MDGSEVRGSHNATVIARYGERPGVASFTVWMPELPLTVHVGDTKLSQVRGWRAPDPASPGAFALKMPAGGGAASDEDLALAPQEDPATPPASASSYSGACSVRYQQTPVQVREGAALAAMYINIFSFSICLKIHQSSHIPINLSIYQHT